MCQGEGKGKWICDPMPNCKVLVNGQRVYKPVGSRWVDGTAGNKKKCNCVSENDVTKILCIPYDDVSNLEVRVSSAVSSESGDTVQLTCDYDDEIDTNDVIVTWYKRQNNKRTKEKLPNQYQNFTIFD